MDVWYFTEQSYHPAWDKFPGALRVDIPGHHADPALMSKLLNEYLDQYVLADELGMNIMFNEHHTAATCLNISVTMALGVMARQTKNARLLGLGSIISNRPDPVRVAEEYAWIDNVSGGRLEMGMVKGAGWELFASNANPAGMMDRFWEAHDLILAAMTRNDAPFAWEGEHFNYRNINLWPRGVQQPHPPIWMSANSNGSATLIARRGYRMFGFIGGFPSKPVYDTYRRVYAETFGHAPQVDRLAYLGMVAIGKTRAEAAERTAQMKAYLASVRRMNAAHVAPSGYGGPEEFAAALRSPSRGRMNAGGGPPRYLPSGKAMSAVPTDAELAEAGMVFSGEPQEVLDQILAFNEHMEGLGHLGIMAQAAALTHEDACDNLRLFAEHVLPTLKGLDNSVPSGRMAVEAAE
ncbi:LLM class flavin-dependent oxidoreductase [Novosphingobium bradum]|uniref:LLM class flavin-dependent oxidoreductase n=1 Tax=Novosphingobium bradum TaxID=1737444 RepID=A0ABV7IP18_9SPHN